MAVKKSASDSKKAAAKAYKEFDKAGKNKLAKLQRHLKKHPNDAQAEGAVKTARDYKGRTQPKRVGARINPYIGERDKITLGDKEADMYINNRSLNLLNGRLSALGKRVQEAVAFSKAVRNQAQFDKNGKVFPKPKMTRDERVAAKARAMGKDATALSKAKQKKVKANAKKA